MADNRYKVFDDWRTEVEASCGRASYWKVIDEWCYSTLSNTYHETQMMYHLCDGSHRKYLKNPNSFGNDQITYMCHTHCVSCGREVPEGLKMIVMLLESNI